MRNYLAFCSIIALSACAVGPDYKAPSFSLPESWFASETPVVEHAPLPLNWWTLFNDETLTKLEEEGLKHNADIALAAARVAEARATLRVTDSNLYPNLSGQAGTTRTSRSKESTFGGAGLSSSKPYNDFNISAVLNYEIDLWGKLRRASESAQADLLAEKINRDAVQLAVTSDIATGYFNLLALDAQTAITRDTIKTRNDAFTYQKKQYDAGAVDVLTFRRAEAELAAAEATLPLLEQAYAEQDHALSILLGRSPKDIIGTSNKGATTLADLPVAPVMPADAPSTLLERRPDIAAAEQRLIASNALIGVAKADYYPSLSLSALIGLASTDIDRLLRTSARTWNAGASAAAPILDFGRTSGNVDAAKARNAQMLISYQQTVRSAFGEVADALKRIQTSNSRMQAQTRQVNAYNETSRVAKLRYAAGYANQLDQLDAERQLFAAKLDEVSARQQQLAATVTLYKALGGGWQVGSKKTTATPSTRKTEKESAAKTPADAPFKAQKKPEESAITNDGALPADAPFKRQKR